MRVTEVSYPSMAGSFSALAQRLRRLSSRVQVAAMAVSLQALQCIYICHHTQCDLAKDLECVPKVRAMHWDDLINVSCCRVTLLMGMEQRSVSKDYTHLEADTVAAE